MSFSLAYDQLHLHSLKLLSGRPHSIQELKRKLQVICMRRQRFLKSKQFSHFQELDCGELVGNVIEKLQNEGHLNDTKYAEWHVSQRQLHRPRSWLQIKGELSAKGILPTIADHALNGYDEVMACVELCSRSPRLMMLSNLDRVKFLKNKGFSMQTITRAESTLKKMMHVECRDAEER